MTLNPLRKSCFRKNAFLRGQTDNFLGRICRAVSQSPNTESLMRRNASVIAGHPSVKNPRDISVPGQPEKNTHVAGGKGICSRSKCEEIDCGDGENCPPSIFARLYFHFTSKRVKFTQAEAREKKLLLGQEDSKLVAYRKPLDIAGQELEISKKFTDQLNDATQPHGSAAREWILKQDQLISKE